MKKIISALVERPQPRPPRISIVREQSSPVPHSPSKPISISSSGANRSRPEPPNPQPKPFFHRWLDTWRSQNGGDHGQSR
jgi:hypothetical protein